MSDYASHTFLADHVAMDAEKKKNYLHLYMLRCFMSQTVPQPSELLRPHYAFVVEKSNYAVGKRSVRATLVPSKRTFKGTPKKRSFVSAGKVNHD